MARNTLSAKVAFNRRKLLRKRMNTRHAPSRCCQPAPWTMTASSSPRVSTVSCCFGPANLFPASYPLSCLLRPRGRTAVDHCRCASAFLSRCDTGFFAKAIMELLPDSIAFPFAEHFVEGSQFGKSQGSDRHWHPVRVRQRLASKSRLCSIGGQPRTDGSRAQSIHNLKMLIRRVACILLAINCCEFLLSMC